MKKGEKMNNFKIGIVGPLKSCIRIEKIILKKYQKLEGKIYPVEKIEDILQIIELIKTAQNECQGMIFTGIGVYLKVKEHISQRLPHVFIPYLCNSIIKAFWDLKKNFPEKKIISIDTIKKENLEEIIEEFEIDDIKSYLLEYNPKEKEENILNFHEKFQKKDKEIVAISGFSWVYEELQKRGYNVIRLYATNCTIEDKIRELEYELKVQDEKESKLLVQILEIKGEKNERNPYKWLEINSLAENMIIPYLKEIKGSIYNSSWNSFTIFSTFGAVNNSENMRLLKNILQEMEKKKIKMSIGNGIGKSVLESEVNAKKALGLAKRYEKNCIFQINKNKVVGPILDKEELDYDFYKTNEYLNGISEKTNISLIHLKKIISIIKKEGKRDFTSEELAFYLNITQRSTTRIMKKLVEYNYALEVKDMFYMGVGRPKKVIKIKI